MGLLKHHEQVIMVEVIYDYYEMRPEPLMKE